MRILMLLLRHRADVNIRDRQGCTPLYDAAERNVPAAVRILVAWAPASNGLTVWEETCGTALG
jgi:ankyrin repeat protein